ncbi:MAG TPA: hypothetical protein VEB68_03895 [Croceibacterium sp.]|nr:hypothetical protein [Croceibacterium sp.]
MTREVVPVAAGPSLVAVLLDACPFLRARVDPEHLDLPTVVYGEVASLLIDRKLQPDEERAVFSFLNELAFTGGSDALEVLGTGAIELFNDSADAQRLGRANFEGTALRMLEDCRVRWGQADYG